MRGRNDDASVRGSEGQKKEEQQETQKRRRGREEEGKASDGSDSGADRARRRKYRAMEVVPNEISKYQAN